PSRVLGSTAVATTAGAAGNATAGGVCVTPVRQPASIANARLTMANILNGCTAPCCDHPSRGRCDLAAASAGWPSVRATRRKRLGISLIFFIDLVPIQLLSLNIDE